MTTEQMIAEIEKTIRLIHDDPHVFVRIIHMSGNGWAIDCNGYNPNLESKTLVELLDKTIAWKKELDK